MKLILSTHNVTLTKAIEEHILSRIDKLEHFDRFAVRFNTEVFGAVPAQEDLVQPAPVHLPHLVAVRTIHGHPLGGLRTR